MLPLPFLSLGIFHNPAQVEYLGILPLCFPDLYIDAELCFPDINPDSPHWHLLCVRIPLAQSRFALRISRSLGLFRVRRGKAV